MSSPYAQVDVFTRVPGGGNPLGVVLDASGWSDAAMQRFAEWTDLVETTFVLPPQDASASYRLRIFTPYKEIPFAGHPTIGSAHAVLEAGLATPRDGQLIQECGAGLLPVRIDASGESLELFVQAPSATVLRTGLDDRLLRQILRNLDLGALPPAFVEGGRRWWMAEFASEEAVRSFEPDHAAIRALAGIYDALGLCVFARCQGGAANLVVRAFPAGVGIIEDPASGAANGLIAAYIRHGEPTGALSNGYTVSQGREMGHDATIRIRYDADHVWVGGKTHTLIRGETLWSPHG